MSTEIIWGDTQYEGYQVSQYGDVRHAASGRVRKLRKDKYGYWIVTIRGRPAYVHVMVAHAFIGPRPEGMYVCHGPLRHECNHLTNIRYDTPAANSADRVRDGTGGKLTRQQAMDAKALVDSGMQCSAVAKMYGVSRQIISCIKRGKRWQM